MVCFSEYECGCWWDEDEEEQLLDTAISNPWKAETQKQFQQKLTLEQHLYKLKKENRILEKNLRANQPELMDKENEIIKIKSQLGLAKAELEYTKRRLAMLQSALYEKETTQPGSCFCFY